MIFWLVHFLFAFLALALFAVNWRLAVVVAFALFADIASLLGMTLPTFGLLIELLLGASSAAAVGLLVSARSKSSWVPLIVCLSTLFILRGTAYLSGVSHHAIASTLPESAVLLVATGLGFLAAHALSSEVRRSRPTRQRSRGSH